jgi:hypothetical protein
LEQLFWSDDVSAVLLQTVVGRDEFRLLASPAIPYAISRIFFCADFIESVGKDDHVQEQIYKN